MRIESRFSSLYSPQPSNRSCCRQIYAELRRDHSITGALKNGGLFFGNSAATAISLLLSMTGFPYFVSAMKLK
jgi:hypothetical protein